MISELEQRAIDAIDLPAMLTWLEAMISFKSLGGSEDGVQDYVAGVMRSLNMEVDSWDVDMQALRNHQAYSAEIERESAVGVVGRAGSGRGKTLVLNGHVDVVPAGEPELWNFDPWRATTTDGRVYGRGAVDMKGGLCCAFAAVNAIRQAGIEIPGTVLIHSVVGEEDGGMGTLATIMRGHIGDGAVVLEPTELMVAPAQAGALNFRLAIRGRAAHGALRTEGVNPFDHYIPIYEAMRDFERSRNEGVTDPLFASYDVPFALCIGKVWSGIWASTVAESLTCEGRLGVATGENVEEVRRAFAAAIREAAESDEWLRENPPVLTWWGAQFEPASTPVQDPVVEVIASSHGAVTGSAPILRGMPYGADMRLLANEGGIPTLLYGPGDVRRAHAPDEFVEIADLVTATQVLVLTILRFCGGG